MKFLTQTRVGAPDGNCLPTCLASMLNYESPEDFLQIQRWFDIDGVYWMAELQKYLIQNHGVMIFNLAEVIPGMIYLRGVRTEKGIDHQTIWRDGEMLHDPNPFKVATWSDGSVHPYDQQFLAFADKRTLRFSFAMLFADRQEFDDFWAHDQSKGPYMFTPEQCKRMNDWAIEMNEKWEKQIAES